MPEPVRILGFGRGALTFALGPVQRDGRRLAFTKYRALPVCMTVGQMLQLIDILRGRVVVGEAVRELCAIHPAFRADAIAPSFRDADLALVEPTSPVDITYRGCVLDWPAIQQRLLAPDLALGPPAKLVANRWLRGLLAMREDIRSQAAGELLGLIPRDLEGGRLVGTIVEEARSRRCDLVGGLRRMSEELATPLALVAAPPAYLPDGRLSPSQDAFQAEVRDAAIALGLPIFEPAEFIADFPGGQLAAFEPGLRRYTPVAAELLLDRFIGFCEQAVDAANHAKAPLELPAAGYTPEHTLGRTEAAAIGAELDRKGVRLLPFPFSSGMAIVSDIDSSDTVRFAGYVSELVGRLGLDFGDSIWLHWHYLGGGDPGGGKPLGFFSRRLRRFARYLGKLVGGLDFGDSIRSQRLDPNGRGDGLGLFSRHMSAGVEEAPGVYQSTHTFIEAVAKYHQGDIDHFHAFHRPGPRVAIVDKPRPLKGGRLVFEPQSFQDAGRWACEDFCVFTVCVVGKAGGALDVRGVCVIRQDGSVTDDYVPAPLEVPAGGRSWRLFRLARSPFDERTVPQLDQVKVVVVELGPKSGPGEVERLLIASSSGDLVLDRLRFLREVCNVELSLVTEHSAVHFRKPFTAEAHDRFLADHVRRHRGPIEAYTGALRDDCGALVFATDADHPHSLCRVFPALSRELEVRFIVPEAADGPRGFGVLNLVSPTATRSGGGVYWARRVEPLPENTAPEDARAVHSGHSSFPGRLLNALAAAEREPGLLWPIYTHLGGLDTPVVPEPYLDPQRMQALQDHVFGISGDVAPGGRMWLARATVLYDYALMMRSLSAHVTRPDPDTVLVTSWRDEALGKTLPRSPGQLYGLTFYVDDTAKAQVRLDGERLETLYRNRPDETGRPSVTIAEADIRHVLFSKLDPLANRPDESIAVDGEWTWREASDGDPAFGNLHVAGDAAQAASLTIPLHGWAAAGAQAVSFAVRRRQGSRFGLLFETLSGGRFLFGDRALLGAAAEGLTASYALDPGSPEGEGWERLAVPFHDLGWNQTARPGGPIPSHPLAAMTILCAGGAGTSVDLADVVFLRPRTFAGRRGEERRFCLGGRVRDFRADDIVHAVPRDPIFGAARQTGVDQRGSFFFDRMAAGIYQVWSRRGEEVFHDRRGALVEIAADTMTLSLGPPV